MTSFIQGKETSFSKTETHRVIGTGQLKGEIPTDSSSDKAKSIQPNIKNFLNLLIIIF